MDFNFSWNCVVKSDTQNDLLCVLKLNKIRQKMKYYYSEIK